MNESSLTMEASYCLCGQPYDPNVFMIQCDACKDWFHSTCCNFQEHLTIEVDKYHCPRCVPIHGPSINKPYRNWHRHDFWDGEATAKPVQTGTAIFIRELRARHFASEGEVVVHMRGQQLTEGYVYQNGFDCPIVVDTKDGLDMTLPSSTSFSVYDVESHVGGDKEIDVIDVTRQSSLKMKLRDFVDYYTSPKKTRVFNVVSLEFTGTGLSPLVEAPLVARKLDWANAIWPQGVPGRPQVQKYCLMSVQDSYTDFHIDFGGTSVWYHVLRGEKIFYFVKPTSANLTLYQQWMTSSNQSETFFGDQVDKCYKCTLRQGQTMLIPTGWIHAVLTPCDSLVFGGNFLHSLNIPMQLSVYDLEKKVKTENKYRYPNFEKINWFAGDRLLQQIIELNVEEKPCPTLLLVGLKHLLASLKQWNMEKDYNLSIREQIPPTTNVPKLIKDIAKEIRHAERYINHLNPPKPERESKRKRKKPVNKDFVDFSSSAKTSQTLSSDNQKPIPIIVPSATSPPTHVPVKRLKTIPPAAPLHDMWEVPPFVRPQETVAIHRGGTVLKFKLGSKDLTNTPQPNPVLMGSLPPTKVMATGELATTTFGTKSIYDFNDESDRDEDCSFTIDENPPIQPLPPNPPLVKKKRGIKMRLPVSRSKKSKPQNGIESLLKASALTTADTQSGRTSPSTREAIAGMLSISQTFVPPGTKRAKKSEPIIDDDHHKNVHQDDDYVYPSLDNSDDEDIHIFKPRGRSKVDEAWNPKARVGPLLPKMNRPAREGTKKQSVEKVLEAAAAKRANESAEKFSPKRQYRRKKTKLKQPDMAKLPPIPHATLQSTSSALLPPVMAVLPPPPPALASSSSAPVAPTPVSTHPSVPKPRKGMKTVKQRLGKILKIHKMIH